MATKPQKLLLPQAYIRAISICGAGEAEQVDNALMQSLIDEWPHLDEAARIIIKTLELRAQSEPAHAIQWLWHFRKSEIGNHPLLHTTLYQAFENLLVESPEQAAILSAQIINNATVGSGDESTALTYLINSIRRIALEDQAYDRAEAVLECASLYIDDVRAGAVLKTGLAALDGMKPRNLGYGPTI